MNAKKYLEFLPFGFIFHKGHPLASQFNLCIQLGKKLEILLAFPCFRGAYAYIRMTQACISTGLKDLSTKKILYKCEF